MTRRRDVRRSGAGGWTRRAFLQAGAAGLLSGCLFGARKTLPRGPVRWPAFRFAHVGGPGLSFAGAGSYRWAHAVAESIRSLPEVDFVLLSGPPVKAGDAFDASLLEAFVETAGVACYGVWPEKTDAPSGLRGLGPGAGRLPHVRPAPWAASPVENVVVAGLEGGGGVASAAMDRRVSFLTDVIDRHPEEAILVVLGDPPRVPSALKKAGGRRLDSEFLRFVLESADGVKMALCGGPGAFVMDRAGLLYVSTPPAVSYPHLFREITVSGHGAVIRNRAVGPAWDREASREALQRAEHAKRFNRFVPGALARALKGKRGTRIYGLR